MMPTDIVSPLQLAHQKTQSIFASSDEVVEERSLFVA